MIKALVIGFAIYFGFASGATLALIEIGSREP